MANTARAALESVLRGRKLDCTLTTALPPLERIDPSALVPTDVAPLDAVLRGGLPRGQLSEISGTRSSGRTTLLLQLLAGATRRGEIAAIVDTFDRLDIRSASDAGMALDRLLWVRGQAVTRMHESGLSAHPDAWGAVAGPAGLFDRTIDRALKALNLVLQAGGFGVVAIDLADVPSIVLRRIPFTTWLRVQRAVEGSDTACVLIVPEPLARSAGGLTLTVTARPTWAGTADRSRRFAGFDMATRVVSPRRRVDGGVAFAAAANDAH
jgi:hypothetical protein